MPARRTDANDAAVGDNIRVRRLMMLLDGAPGAGRRGGKPAALAPLAHPLRLMRAFSAIPDRRMRRALVELVEGIARLASCPRPAKAGGGRP